MNPDRYQQIADLFEQLSGLAPHERLAELDEIGSTDPDLRKELESLFREDGDLQDFLRTPVINDIMGERGGAPGRSSSDMQPLEKIGRYRIRRELGEGGMGVVYLAEQDEPRRPVAVKVIRPGAMSRGMRQRFRQEARVLGLLRHAGIAQVYEAGTEQADGAELAFFAMEYVEGLALNEYVSAKRLSYRARLELLAGICDAIHHAHQKGVVHRDLKPANILVDETGQPKVLDFGVARATDADINTLSIQTQAGQIVGTLPYMSPEQALGVSDEVDTRCDVYALGVIAYELLADKLPLDVGRSSVIEAARIIREEEPTRLGNVNRDYRGDVETIVAKALEKDRERRYASAAEFGADIRRFLGDEPIVARPASTVYQFSKFARRHRGLVFGLATAVVILVTGSVVSIGFAVSAARERDRALSAEHRAEQSLDAAIAAQSEAEEARDAERLQRSEAERQTRIARAVNDFLNDDLLGSVSPTAQGKDVTMQEVLAAASENITGKFEDEPEVEIAVRTTIANTYRALGRHDEVLAHVEANVALERKHYGADHRETLTSQNNLALTYQELGRLDDAERLLKQTLEERRRAWGADDEDVLESMHNLGTLYWIRGKYSEAYAMLSQVLDRYRKIYGDGSPRTLDTVNSLGNVCKSLGRYDEAAALSQEAVETRRRVLGKDHPDTLVSVVNAGVLQNTLGRYAEAQANHAEALEGFRRKLGDEHPNTILTLGNLGATLRNRGLFVEAEQPLTESYESCVRLAGPDHRFTLGGRVQLTALYIDTGRFDEAEGLGLESLERCTSVLGEDHRWTVLSMYELGRLYLETARLDQAQQMAAGGVERSSAGLGPQHFDTLRLKRLLADVRVAQGQTDEAERLYTECLAGLQMTLPSEHPEIGVVVRQQGLILVSEARLADAEARMLESHENLESALGPKHPETKATVRGLVDLYERAGDSANAARWRDLQSSGTNSD